MPKDGIDFVPRKELLSYEEMLRLLKIFKGLGVTKLRITGGEPLVRRGLIDFLKEVKNQGIMEGFHLTTNATITYPYIDDLIDAGLLSVNVSLDTLDRKRFTEITRRDKLETVLESIDALYEKNIPIKLNMVVMKDCNEQDILPMAYVAQDRKIGVRFLEEMPFNGTGQTKSSFFTHHDIKHILTTAIPDMKAQPFVQGTTSQNYTVPTWKGDLGIIASYSRTFCGTCNRLRITPKGSLKTCLYGNRALDLKTLVRDGSSDKEIAQHIEQAVLNKAKDGFEAERMLFNGISESMAEIGG
jgi:cyclic pyranopterin phosphate synthase